MPGTPEQCRRYRLRYPERERSYQRAYRREHPEKKRAHNAVYKAVKSGRLKRGPCVWCYSTRNVEAHHDNYDDPLDVIWLCQGCHVKYHRLLKEAVRGRL